MSHLLLEAQHSEFNATTPTIDDNDVHASVVVLLSSS
jgi:hypothetical protein